jgi:autotransporter translocation and assembly factor TamB
MKNLSRIAIGVGAGLCTAVCFALAVFAHASSEGNNPIQKEAIMANHASGPFDVKITPQKPDNKDAEAANLARMSIDKQFHGDLEGTSKGEMLATSPDAKGSGVYVALERVTGSLKGRSGSFVLHHTGIMTRGVPHLIIEVVPDSGTGQLIGLTGKMMINIAKDGKHSYDFEYTLTEKP